MTARAILWFRRDLRLADNPALLAAIDHGDVLPVYLHAPDEEAPWAPGGAQRVWLHRTLAALDDSLRRRGSRLVVRRGPSLAALQELIAESGADAVFWNRLYEPAAIDRDKAIKRRLQDDGIHAASHNAALLREPWDIATGEGTPYKVFTPFRKALHGEPMAAPRHAPERLPRVPDAIRGIDIEALGLLPEVPWHRGILETWQPGEDGAHTALEAFLDTAAAGYADDRDRPGRAGTSRLSPHLHFGEIGPRQVWHRVHEWLGDGGGDRGAEVFLSELAWREFAHHLLYHFPHTPEEPLDRRFEAFPWADDDAALAAWQDGRTGIPMVDAGMRELWHTGWMHNRVRMVVASFLTKNLRLPWQHGARWFWDTLVDADLANNTLGWQWTAGCGADAAPFFRIFNPVRQGERFDPGGDYVRQWLPELAGLPDRHIHAPWAAPRDTLREAGVALGDDYPAPLVDLKASRREALAAFERIKKG